MFTRPAKMLCIAINDKGEPEWAMAMLPTEIAMQYELHGPSPEIQITGHVIDGPMSMAKVAEDLSGLL